MALAVVSGLMDGLAMQTKYSAFVVPAVLIALGVFHRRAGMALIAAGVAATVFIAWEAFVFATHGQSHFMAALQLRSGALESRARNLLLPTASLTASLAPGVLLLSLLQSSRPGRWLIIGIASLVGCFLMIGIASGVDSFLYVATAVIWWCILIYSIRQRLKSISSHSPISQTNRRVLSILLIWLILEFAFSLVLSPFAASRRVLGITVAATVLVGHVITFRRPSRRLIWMAAGTSICLGIAVALIDIREAHATQELATATAQIVEREVGNRKAWFSGIWEFQYYAIRHGMSPLDFKESRLKSGDLLILTEQQVRQTYFRPEHAPLKLLVTPTIEDTLPWRTLVCYYAGATPVRHHVGPRLNASIYRVLADFDVREFCNFPSPR